MGGEGEVLEKLLLTFALAMASANIFWLIPQSFGTFDWHFLWQFMLHTRRKKVCKLINSFKVLLIVETKF